MIVGICRVSLMIEESQSLKDKRSVLRRIKDRVNQKWNCAIAEVGDPDAWQSAQLAFAVISNERGFTQSMVQKILQFIDDLSIAKITDDEQDYVDYGDGELDSARSDYSHWETDEPSPPRSAPAGVKLPRKLEAMDYPWDSPDPSVTPASGTSPTEGDTKPGRGAERP